MVTCTDINDSIHICLYVLDKTLIFWKLKTFSFNYLVHLITMENEISLKGENIEILMNKVASDKKSAILYMILFR